MERADRSLHSTENVRPQLGAINPRQLFDPHHIFGGNLLPLADRAGRDAKLVRYGAHRAATVSLKKLLDSSHTAFDSRATFAAQAFSRSRAGWRIVAMVSD